MFDSWDVCFVLQIEIHLLITSCFVLMWVVSSSEKFPPDSEYKLLADPQLAVNIYHSGAGVTWLLVSLWSAVVVSVRVSGEAALCLRCSWEMFVCLARPVARVESGKHERQQYSSVLSGHAVHRIMFTVTRYTPTSWPATDGGDR